LNLKIEYFNIHIGGVNPVLLNDVFFALHATLITAFTIYQCFIYDVCLSIIVKEKYLTIFYFIDRWTKNKSSRYWYNFSTFQLFDILWFTNIIWKLKCVRIYLYIFVC
jgi:hypothetical protein